MDFDLDDDQRELRDAARRFLEREAPIAYARAMMDDERGYRDEVWKQMAELGWMALPFGEEHGGLGMGFVALSILCAELGRVLLPGPYLASVACGGLAIAEAAGDDQRARLLPRIAAGDAIATLAHDGDVEARDGRLYGDSRFVLDGARADTVVVVAREGDAGVLCVAEPTERHPVATMDLTRRTAHLRFDGAEAELLGKAEPRVNVVQRIYDRAAVALAAEMLGGAERVLELTVEYALQREQFGRPIGSFQAVKHRAADMLVEVESLRNAVYYAAWASERDHPDASIAASIAKAWASDAYRKVTQSGIQVHGGIGFTWEHDMHLFFKRAKFDEAAFGDATFHRERIARLLREREAQ